LSRWILFNRSVTEWLAKEGISYMVIEQCARFI
jgi:hypothetical protein